MSKWKVCVLKRCRFLLAVFGFFLLQTPTEAQTHLTVLCNGTEQPFFIPESGRIYFDDSYLYVDEGNGLITPVSISLIQKVVFTSPLSIPLSDLTDTTLPVVYPNPVKDYFSVANVSTEKIRIKILSLDGQVVLSGEFISNERINISSLSSGFYLIKVDEVTLKICKI